MKKVNYKVNGSSVTKSLAVWYFGAEFVESLTAAVRRMAKKENTKSFSFFQKGTGFLTIEIN